MWRPGSPDGDKTIAYATGRRYLLMMNQYEHFFLRVTGDGLEHAELFAWTREDLPGGSGQEIPYRLRNKGE